MKTGRKNLTQDTIHWLKHKLNHEYRMNDTYIFSLVYTLTRHIDKAIQSSQWQLINSTYRHNTQHSQPYIVSPICSAHICTVECYVDFKWQPLVFGVCVIVHGNIEWNFIFKYSIVTYWAYDFKLYSFDDYTLTRHFL